MPELYDNDWQPDKTDYTPTGMHIEAMYYYMAKERVPEEDSNHLWSTIVWDDNILSSVWAGYRNAGKTYNYTLPKAYVGTPSATKAGSKSACGRHAPASASNSVGVSHAMLST